jgi:hypothetical protein
MEGGFFLRKKPLGCMVSVNSGIENAVAATVARSRFFDFAALRSE